MRFLLVRIREPPTELLTEPFVFWETRYNNGFLDGRFLTGFCGAQKNHICRAYSWLGYPEVGTRPHIPSPPTGDRGNFTKLLRKFRDTG